jgi:NADPH:quinone reductase-like Zn-dependent oxidoreductase
MRVYELAETNGIESLKQAERPDPSPGEGEVVLLMKAASLNYRDLLVAKGQYPNLRLPLVPLSDGAGIVLAVGENVSRVKPGDRVAGIFNQNWIAGESPRQALALGGDRDGVLAQQVVLPQDGVVRIPGHLSFEEASTLPCAGVTAWNALMVSGGLKPGETVLIQGTGGVSLFALQFAQMAGARTIVTSSSDRKLERVRSLGADAVINYRTTPDWDREALRLTGGLGVDHVVEVGGAETLPRSLGAVRPNGHIAVIGVLSGGSAQIPLFPMLVKQVRLQGIYVGSRLFFERMNDAISQNTLKPIIDRTFSFEEAPDAFRYMESGDHSGKIVLRF